jgi:hypothetical protein
MDFFTHSAKLGTAEFGKYELSKEQMLNQSSSSMTQSMVKARLLCTNNVLTKKS